MLNLMRKHASSWMIKIVLFAIVVVFVFWGVGSMRSQNETQVAEVNGEVIPLEVYRQTYYRLLDQYRRIYGGQVDDNLLKMLRPNEMALNQLIERVLMRQEADRLKIEVGSDELAQAIYAMQEFQVNGAFNKERYFQILAQNNLSDQGFRMDRSEALLLNKLRSVLLIGIVATEDEAREQYDWTNAKVSVDYVLFTPARYSDLQPTDEEVRAFFDDHKDNYRTQPQIKATYVQFDTSLMKSSVEISDDTIAAYYESHPEDFQAEKRVNARHILFKVDQGADASVNDSQKAEAKRIYEMAKAGKDFAELARQYSEGPTKDKGGDLGWFTRTRMVKPFADKAFSMAAGEIGEPIRTDFGWHVIKVEQIEEATTRSLEEATNEILTKLTNDKAKELALEKAEALYESVYDGDDLMEAGKAQQAPVRETDYFTAEGPKDSAIVQGRKFAQIAFGLEKMGISEVQDMGSGYVILQVTDRKEAAIPEFDQVAARVKTDTLKDQQRQKAKTDAEAFIAELKKGGTFDAVGAQYSAQPMETPLFGRNAPIPQIGTEQQINEAAFGLTTEKPLAESAVEGRKGWYVIRLKERQTPEDEGFVNEKDSIVQRLTEQKRQAAYQAWLTDLRSRSEITVNQSLIEQ